MAECVVIGANGFLGSHLVDELVARGREVLAFDRFSSGRIGFRAEGVPRLAGDFMNHADVAAAVRGARQVFHFLSTTTPATAEDDPTLDIRTNIAASVDLLAACAEANVEKLFFASTGGAIYGEQRADALTEETLPRPVSPYAIGKLAVEGYLRYFSAKRGLDSVALRISNPYGPRQPADKKQGVISIFLHSIAAGEPITVYGDGSMVRDFVFASDAVAQIADLSGRPTRHDVYNVGAGVGHSIADVAELAREVTGREFEVRRATTPPTFVSKVVLDTTRIRTEFGARPMTSLRDGMAATWRAIVEGRA